MASTLSFALRVLKGRIIDFRDRTCPYCQSSETQAVGRKHIILQLRVCRKCGLKYRFPKDNPSYSESYYESDYVEPSVTGLPSQDHLPKLIATAFKNSPFDKSDKVDFIMSRLGPEGKDAHILDYGASFGYLMVQLRSRGAKNLLGHEIARQRAQFGVEHLGEQILSTPSEVLAHPLYPFDVILTSHVLEHLSRIGETLDFFGKALKHPGGQLLIWVPNASLPALDRFHNSSWAALIGEPHQFAFDYEFFFYSLPRHGFRIVETGVRSDAEIRLLAEAI